MERKIIILFYLIVSFCPVNSKAQSKEMQEHVCTILEKYCVEYYDSCFGHGYSHYIPKSLMVDSMEVDAFNKVIKVRGKLYIKEDSDTLIQGYHIKLSSRKKMKDI